VPTPEEIKKSVAKVGYKKYILDTKITLFFSEEGMKLGLVVVKDLL
jgi:thiamine biosynthesis lipoprotein